MTTIGTATPTRPGHFRTGSHNPRNIYRAGLTRDTDEHVAVAFTPEFGKLVVTALNAFIDGPGVP